MRIQLQVSTDPHSRELPIEYRRACLSLLKTALTNYCNGEFFTEFYDSNRPKSFSFAVGLPRGIKFSGDKILLPEPSSRLNVTISSADLKESAILCNALMTMKGKQYPLKGNVLTLHRIIVLPEKQVNRNSHILLIRMLSPLCIREHVPGKERYITVDDEDFAEQFNRVIAYQLRDRSDFTENEKRSVQIIPYEMKKTVVRHYGQKIACSLGTAVMTASPDVLNYLYQSGMGSRRSAGFGLFDIISISEERG